MSHGKSEFAYIFERAVVPDAVLCASRAVQQQLRGVRKSLVRKGTVTMVAGILAMAGVQHAQAQASPIQTPYVRATLNPEAPAFVQRNHQLGQLASGLTDQSLVPPTVSVFSPVSAPQAIRPEAPTNATDGRTEGAPTPVDAPTVGRPQPASVFSTSAPTQSPDMQQTVRNSAEPVTLYNGRPMAQLVCMHLIAEPQLSYSTDQVARAVAYKNGVVVMPDKDNIQTLFTLDKQGEIVCMPVDFNLSVRRQVLDMAKMQDMGKDQAAAYANELVAQRQAALAQASHFKLPEAQDVPAENDKVALSW